MSETIRPSRRAVLRAGLALAVAAPFVPRPSRAAAGWDAVRAAANDALGGRDASLLVATKDQVVFKEAFGSALLQVPTMLASASMGPSALAVLAAVDGGALKLDDPLGALIPALTGEKAAMTLRQCLAHSAGLHDPGNLLVPPDKDPGVTLAEEVDDAAKKKLAFAPGSRFAFGGMSYQAAGRAVEIATNTPWELWFKQAIDDPLGVSFTFGETPDPRLAAGASASLDSFGALLQLLLNDGELNGAKVLSKASVKALRTNQLGAITTATPVADGVEVHGYGLGWWLESVDESGVAISINAAGAFGTVPWVDFAKGYAAVLMMTDKAEAGARVAAKIRPVIESALAAG